MIENPVKCNEKMNLAVDFVHNLIRNGDNEAVAVKKADIRFSIHAAEIRAEINRRERFSNSPTLRTPEREFRMERRVVKY